MSFLWTFRSFEICHIPIVCFCCFCKNLQRASPTLFLRPLLPVYPLEDGCTVVARLCANIVDKFFTTVQPLWSPWPGLSLRGALVRLHLKLVLKMQIVQPSHLLRFPTARIVVQRRADGPPAVTRHLLYLGYAAVYQRYHNALFFRLCISIIFTIFVA